MSDDSNNGSKGLADAIEKIESLERDETILGSGEGVELVRKSIEDVKREFSAIVNSLKTTKARFSLETKGDHLLIRGPFGSLITISGNQTYSNSARDFSLRERLWFSEFSEQQRSEATVQRDWFPNTTPDKGVVWSLKNGEGSLDERELASVIATTFAEEIKKRIPSLRR